MKMTSSPAAHHYLSGNRPAVTRIAVPHPRGYRTGVLQNFGSTRKADKGVASNIHRPLPIKSRSAGAKNGVVDQVTALDWPVLKNVDRVFEAGNLPDQIFPVLDENGRIEQAVAHRFLLNFQQLDNTQFGFAPPSSGASGGSYWNCGGAIQQPCGGVTAA